ncbi:MAG: carbohydrate ABC transporter permease [Clostridiales bacterium]|nr:carbohydrate ABC transporter permease [Clostridiales bacterium]
MKRQHTLFNPRHFSVRQLPLYAFLVPLALFMSLPIVFIIGHAFKPLSELFAFPPKFFVKNPTLDNFERMVQTTQSSGIDLTRYLFNSLIVTLAVVIGTIIIGSMASFAMSKMRFKGKALVFEINTVAMMFVPVAVRIPRYLVINTTGIMDTYLAYILPMLALPVGVFLVKQFMDQIPDSLIEAAYVDGANHLTIYFKIVIPLIKPAIATIAILSFQQVWNDTEAASLYVTKESMRTLTFFMNTMAGNTTGVAGQGVAAAASLIMFLPNLIIFICMQSKVMNTMAYSGMK